MYSWNEEEKAEEERRTHVISLESAVVQWDTRRPFNTLMKEEKLYAHFLSRAAWYGALLIPVQTSPESPAIFALLHDMFRSNTIPVVREIAADYCFFWEEDFQELLVYTCGIFTNGGNYLGYGDTKFLPGLSLQKMNSLLIHENVKFNGLGRRNARDIWGAVKYKVYSLEEREKQLGLGQQGVTTYFSPNCTPKDAALVSRFMMAYQIDPLNTRVFKVDPNTNPTFDRTKRWRNMPVLPILMKKPFPPDTRYEVRTASVEGDHGYGCAPRFDFENTEFMLTQGDYWPILKDIRYWLGRARTYAANAKEKEMITKYIESFSSGSVDAHKEGTRLWIHNKQPSVETYIGFVETYRDPAGVRAEFEGFVFITDRELSEVFGNLVKNAKTFLSRLPWPSEFERETFIEPDFTAQDVLCYASSCIFDGINMPNYDDIRQKDGFKNMAMGRVYAALYADAPTPFLSPIDSKLHAEFFTRAHDVQVGIHELLGHGSGKLLVRKDDGSTNFPSELRNPLTNSFIESVYETEETYDSLFTGFGSSMEECRAECVGLYLSLDDDVLKIFGYEGEVAENIKYANWLELCYNATALCLKAYSPKLKQWKHGHNQAKFAILQVLLEAGQGLVRLEEKVSEDDGISDLRLTLDRAKIQTIGKKAIGDFLLKIQIYKSTADVQSAQRIYRKYTAVSDDGVYPWLKWREITLTKQQPQRLCIQPNTFLSDDGTDVKIVTYESSFEGLVQSWIERYDDDPTEDPTLYDQLDTCWRKDREHFF